MDYYQIIANNFQTTIETIALSVDDLAQGMEQGSQLMTRALLEDRKIIACGNGVDAAVAQLFACNLLDRFEEDRPALPALALGTDHASLTAIAESGSIHDIFSRQLRAFGQAGDVLLCVSSGAGTTNLSHAVQTAQDRNMGVVVMSNAQDVILGALLRPEDVELRVNARRQARTVELHTMIIHSICELIDHNLFGTYNQE
jgi:D-sedoheptulose 7-phosphate isomerase